MDDLGPRQFRQKVGRLRRLEYPKVERAAGRQEFAYPIIVLDPTGLCFLFFFAYQVSRTMPKNKRLANVDALLL
jgi:hypothetical protein